MSEKKNWLNKNFALDLHDNESNSGTNSEPDSYADDNLSEKSTKKSDYFVNDGFIYDGFVYANLEGTILKNNLGLYQIGQRSIFRILIYKRY